MLQTYYVNIVERLQILNKIKFYNIFTKRRDGWVFR